MVINCPKPGDPGMFGSRSSRRKRKVKKAPMKKRTSPSSYRQYPSRPSSNFMASVPNQRPAYPNYSPPNKMYGTSPRSIYQIQQPQYQAPLPSPPVSDTQPKFQSSPSSSPVTTVGYTGEDVNSTTNSTETQYSCTIAGCNFKGSYDCVEKHEASAHGLFSCENLCGYTGDWDTVVLHEKHCHCCTQKSDSSFA